MIFDEFYRAFLAAEDAKEGSPELESEARALYEVIGDGEEFAHIRNPSQTAIKAYQFGKRVGEKTSQ